MNQGIRRALLVAFATFLVLTGAFFAAYNPVEAANNTSITPSFSITGNNAYENYTYNYYKSSSISNSGTTTVTVPIQENSSFSTYSMASTSSWNTGGSSASRTQTLDGAPNYTYAGNDDIVISSLAVKPGQYTYNIIHVGSYTVWGVGTVSATFNLAGTSYSQTWSHTYNTASLSSSSYLIFTPTFSFTPSVIGGNQVYSDIWDSTISFSYTAYVSSGAFSLWNTAPSDLYTVSQDAGQNTTVSGQPTYVQNRPLVKGYHLGTASSTFSLNSKEISYNIAWSTSSNIKASYSGNSQTSTSGGTFTGKSTSSISFQYGGTGDPNLGMATTSGYSASYYLENQLIATSQSTASNNKIPYAISSSGSQTNQFNSSLSFSIPSPSGIVFSDLSGSLSSSYSGTVANLTQEYPTADYELWRYSMNGGSYITQANAKEHSVSFSQTVTSVQTFSYSLLTEELTNQAPIGISSTVSNTNIVPDTPITLTIYATEPSYLLPEPLYATVNWGDGSHTTTPNQNSPATFILSHTYTGPGTYTPTYTVTNVPGPSSVTTVTSSQFSASPITVSAITMNPTPTAGTEIGKDQYFNLSFSSPSGTNVSTVNLTINGAVKATYHPDTYSGSESYHYTSLIYQSQKVIWTAYTSVGYNQSTTIDYSSKIYPILNASYINIAYSASLPVTTTTNQLSGAIVGYYNLTHSIYEYSIPIPKNVNYAEVYFNQSWLLYSSFLPYVLNSSNDNLILEDLANYTGTNVPIEFVQPTPLNDRYVVSYVNLVPTSAVQALAGALISPQLFNISVRDVSQGTLYSEIYNGQFNALLGDTYSIDVRDTFGNLIGSATATIEQNYQFTNVNILIWPVTFTNLNATETVFSLTENNHTEQLFYLGYMQSYIVWIPSGSYNVTISPYSPSVQLNPFYVNLYVNSPSFVLEDGPLLQTVSDVVSSGQDNITSQLTSVNITLYNQGTSILNQTVNVSVNILNLNSTIRDQFLSVTNNISTIESLVQNMNLSVSTQLNLIYATIYNVNLNLTTKMNFISDLINQTQDVNGWYPLTLTNVPQEGEIPITITNSQTNATGTYQQLINFPTAQYKYSINSQFSDVYFAYQNGTTIPAWIQSNASNTYTTTPIWLNLSSIGGSSSVTVYAHIVPNSDFFGNSSANIGEAAILSPVYGEYDNIVTVFEETSTDFAGTSFPNTWHIDTQFNGSIHNGVYLNDSSWGGIEPNPLINSTQYAWLLGFYANTTGTSNSAAIGYDSSARLALGGNPYALDWGLGGNHQIGGTLNVINYFTGWDYNQTIFNATNLQTGNTTWGSSSPNILTDLNHASIRSSIPNTMFYVSDYAIRKLPANGYGFTPKYSFGTLTSSSDTTQYYQQLLKIPYPAVYDLNSNVSNFQITNSAKSPIYAWIQSYNTTEMDVWAKVPYSTSNSTTLYMHVFSKSYNELSASGYIGEAPQLSSSYAKYDNGLKIFGYNSGMKNYYNYTNANNSYLPLPVNATYDRGINVSTNDGAKRSGNGAYFSTSYNWTTYFNITSFGYNSGNGIIYLHGFSDGGYYGYSTIYNETNVVTAYEKTNVGNYLNARGVYWQGTIVGQQWHFNLHWQFFVRSMKMPSISIGNPTWSNNSALFSVQTMVNIINSSLSSLNFNNTQYFTIVNDSIHNLNLSSQQYYQLLSSSITNLNVNLSTKFNLVKVAINDFNFNETTRFNILNTSLKDLTFNDTQYFTLINASVHNLNLSDSQYYGLLSSSIKNLNLNVTTKYDILLNSIGNLSVSETDQYNILNLSVHDLTFNTTQYFQLLNTSVINLNLSSKQYYNLLSASIADLNINVSQEYNTLKSTIGNLSFTETQRFNLINASLNTIAFNDTQYFDLLNTSVKDLNLSDQQYYNLLSSSITNLNLTLGTKFTIILSAINDFNVNESTAFNLVHSAINNLAFNDSQYFIVVNDSLHNLNLSDSQYYLLLSSSIGDLNVNLSTKFDIIRNSISDFNVNESTRFKILNTSINDLAFNDSQYFDLVNLSIHNLNISDRQYYTLLSNSISDLNLNISTQYDIVKSAIGNLTVSESTQFRILNVSLHDLTFNDTQYFQLVNLSIHDLNLSDQQYFSLVQTSIADLNLNITTKYDIIYSAISNLTVNETTRYDILYSSIHDLTFNDSQYFTLLNTSLHNLNLTDKQYYNVLYSSITDLNLNISTQFSIVESAIGNISVNQSEKFTILQTSLNDLAFNDSQYFDLVNLSLHDLNLSDNQYYLLLHNAITDLNLNVTTQYDILESAIGNLSFNDSTQFSIVESALGNIQFNDSQYFSLLNLSLHNLNLSDSQEFTLLHNAITDVNLNISQEFNITDGAIKDLNITENTRYNLLKLAISDLSFNDSQYFVLVNTSIHSLNLSEKQYFGILYSSITDLNLNLSTEFKLMEASVSDLNFNESSRFNVLNTSLNYLSFNETQYFELLNLSLHNLNLSNSQSFTLLNDSIRSNYISLLSNLTYINTTIGNENLSIQVRLAYYYSLIKSNFVNISVRQSYTNALLNASSYSMKIGTPTVSGDNYTFPVRVIDMKTLTPANLTVTDQAWQNMKVLFTDYGTLSLPYTIKNVVPGFFDLVIRVTGDQTGQIKNNSAFISLSSPILTGAVPQVAAGEINATNILAGKLPWYLSDFGFKTWPPGSFFGDLKWFFFSIPTLMSAGVLGGLIALYYLMKIVHDLRYGKREREEAERREKAEKRRDREQKEMNERLDRIDSKLGGK